MKYEFAVFDFDGTIVDSGDGIMKSAHYALESYGIKSNGYESLSFFVGPPLIDSFQYFDGVDEDMAEKLVSKYRERYGETGIFECTVYEKIETLLKTLCSSGVKLSIGSSKPKKFVERLLEHLDFLKYFTYISAIDMNNAREPKSEIIARALKNSGCLDTSKAIMVGDRCFDIQGANELGLDSIGVLYGYGSLEEFEEHGATYIAHKPMDIADIILL